jgi:hypothetical protein
MKDVVPNVLSYWQRIALISAAACVACHMQDNPTMFPLVLPESAKEFPHSHDNLFTRSWPHWHSAAQASAGNDATSECVVAEANQRHVEQPLLRGHILSPAKQMSQKQKAELEMTSVTEFYHYFDNTTYYINSYTRTCKRTHIYYIYATFKDSALRLAWVAHKPFTLACVSHPLSSLHLLPPPCLKQSPFVRARLKHLLVC